MSWEVISTVSILSLTPCWLFGRGNTAKIYEEIKQNKPLLSPGQVAVITIFRTADVVRHAIERSLSAFGLSNEQFNILRILRGAGENGLPTLEISSRMLSRSPNITRLIDRLIVKKLARRSPSKEDGASFLYL